MKHNVAVSCRRRPVIIRMQAGEYPAALLLMHARGLSGARQPLRLGFMLESEERDVLSTNPISTFNRKG